MASCRSWVFGIGYGTMVAQRRQVFICRIVKGKICVSLRASAVDKQIESEVVLYMIF
jgi:hypothetical protein